MPALFTIVEAQRLRKATHVYAFCALVLGAAFFVLGIYSVEKRTLYWLIAMCEAIVIGALYTMRMSHTAKHTESTTVMNACDGEG